MTNTEAVNAVLAWVADVCPEVATSTYDHLPQGKTKALPDAVGDVDSEAVVRQDPDFPTSAIQQVGLRVWGIGVSFMAEAGHDEAGASAATNQLRDFAERLIRSLLEDHTLGGRVALASPYIEWDYTPPFVEYEDGVRGREVAMQIKVAEPLVGEGAFD